MCKRRWEGRVLWNGQKARFEFESEEGWKGGCCGWMGWMCVMAWCQTLFHYQCLPHQLIPQWSATVQCVSKPLCLLPLLSVCLCCCVVPLFALGPFSFLTVIGFGDIVIPIQSSHMRDLWKETASTNGLKLKKKNKKNKKEEMKILPEPGVDPGSSEPQSDILPLNYSGFQVFLFSNKGTVDWSFREWQESRKRSFTDIQSTFL